MARLEGRQLLARAPENRGLHVEFLAGHEVELCELGLQHALEVLLEVTAQGHDALRHGSGEAPGKVVDEAGVEGHGRGDTAVGGRG